jgi:hypothetical protein
MPMDATPFEQEVVAEATKFTGDETLEPSLGLLTVTPASAKLDKKHKRNNRRKLLIGTSPGQVFSGAELSAFSNRGGISWVRSPRKDGG